MCSSSGDPNRKEATKSTGKKRSVGMRPIPPGPRPVPETGLQEAPVKELKRGLGGGVVAGKSGWRQLGSGRDSRSHSAALKTSAYEPAPGAE